MATSVEGKEGRRPGMSERPKNMRSFWDQHARKDAHIAIYDSAEIRDPELREEAFEAAGKRDARSLWPFVDPGKTVVEAAVKDGRLVRLSVSPESRRKDIILPDSIAIESN